MIKTINRVYPFYILIDIIFISLSFFISYFLTYSRSAHPQNIVLYYKEYIFLFILWGIFTIFSFKRKNLYSTDRNLSIPGEIYKVIMATLRGSILITAVFFAAKCGFFSRQIFLQNLLFLNLSLSGWRIVKRLFLRKLISEGFHNINILIIGTNDAGKIALEEIRKKPHWGFKIIGFLNGDLQEDLDGVPILGRLKDFPVIAKKYFVDEVIITLSMEKGNVSEIIKQAKNLNLGIRVVPENFEEPVQSLNIAYIGILPVLTYQEKRIHPTEMFLKRLFDFIVSLFLIIVLFPLFIILSILIKLDSHGPIFFVQKRLGFKKRDFNLIKFRSMIKEADSLKNTLLEKNEVKDGIIFKIRNDPRMTSLGVFLRKYSLDELPQLFNVLKGDMSLVGPRPPTIEEVEQYNHYQLDRLLIRPGITGLSQIKARSKLSFKRWVRWDLWYINNWSFVLDLQILWLTIPSVIKGMGV